MIVPPQSSQSTPLEAPLDWKDPTRWPLPPWDDVHSNWSKDLLSSCSACFTGFFTPRRANRSSSQDHRKELYLIAKTAWQNRSASPRGMAASKKEQKQILQDSIDQKRMNNIREKARNDGRSVNLNRWVCDSDEIEKRILGVVWRLHSRNELSCRCDDVWHTRGTRCSESWFNANRRLRCGNKRNNMFGSGLQMQSRDMPFFLITRIVNIV